ncbi:MAG: hypothetical protein HY586_08045, partial [Candidatus Omnitrophica bacterium]|nr:hypothetical protein [Candidatus Omnitrophota bacterium]
MKMPRMAFLRVLSLALAFFLLASVNPVFAGGDIIGQSRDTRAQATAASVNDQTASSAS